MNVWMNASKGLEGKGVLISECLLMTVYQTLKLKSLTDTGTSPRLPSALIPAQDRKQTIKKVFSNVVPEPRRGEWEGIS